jgi:hypothetical protein
LVRLALGGALACVLGYQLIVGRVVITPRFLPIYIDVPLGCGRPFLLIEGALTGLFILKGLKDVTGRDFSTIDL